MKWETPSADRYYARCGHLYVRLEPLAAYETPGHPHYAPAQCDWFVEPDDEDKSYRRALATGSAVTVEAAKEAVRAVCAQLAADMLKDLEPAT